MKYLIFSFLISASVIFAEDINDPFEDLNRLSFEFNESLDANILKPIAQS